MHTQSCHETAIAAPSEAVGYSASLETSQTASVDSAISLATTPKSAPVGDPVVVEWSYMDEGRPSEGEVDANQEALYRN